MQRSLLFAVAMLIGCGAARPAPVATPAEPPQLWMQVAGQGDVTVVFEAGGGDDSSVWAGIEPDVRRSNGVRTVVYDRAGLGKSAPAPGPYHIDDEAAALVRALDRFAIKAPIVLVAHSYGGFVATLVAAKDARVTGVVLVDANLAALFDAAELAHLEAKYAPQLAALEQAKPALARVLIPVMRAYPETAKRMRAVVFPPALPVIDIVAEHSWGDSDEENAAMRRVHDAFVAGSPARHQVVATGSGHQVMHDRPEVVTDAIAAMIRSVRSR